MPPLAPAPVTADETTHASRPFSPLLSWLIGLLVVGKCAWLFAAPLRSATLPLRLAQDDFYYYLKVAQNLAWIHRSTFDGTTLTNGYHPLYFLLLTVVSLFVHTLRGVFRFLWVLDVLSATAVFLLSRRLFARLGSQLLANAFAVLITALCFTSISDQMEVTLTLPLGFAFLLAGFVTPAELTSRRAALLGFLGALLTLSRLDAGLLVFLYAVGLLSQRSYRAVLTPQILGAFLATSFPLPLLYLWINHHFFGTLLPISGMAKELRHGHAPSTLVPRSFNGTNEALLLLAAFAAVLAWALRKRLDGRERVFLSAVLSFPFFFYALEMLLSDWPLWSWYFYALRFSAAGACLLFAATLSGDLTSWGISRSWQQSFFAVLLGLCGLKFASARYRVDVVMVEIQHAAETFSQFAATHPGTYAMGDRSGMFAMLVPYPIVQTEGLMMDRDYLDHLRHEEDLRSVLSRYHVDYFVSFVPERELSTSFTGTCFHAREPFIAGASALRMRSDFCQPYVQSFAGDDGRYFIYRLSAD